MGVKLCIFFKFFIFLFFTVNIFPEFVRSVEITGTNDAVLINKLNAKFKGVITTGATVENYLNELRKLGIFESISYDLKKKQGSLLKYLLIIRQSLNLLILKGSPINHHLLY